MTKLSTQLVDILLNVRRSNSTDIQIHINEYHRYRIQIKYGMSPIKFRRHAASFLFLLLIGPNPT